MKGAERQGYLAATAAHISPHLFVVQHTVNKTCRCWGGRGARVTWRNSLVWAHAHCIEALSSCSESVPVIHCGKRPFLPLHFPASSFGLMAHRICTSIIGPPIRCNLQWVVGRCQFIFQGYVSAFSRQLREAKVTLRSRKEREGQMKQSWRRQRRNSLVSPQTSKNTA